MLLVIDNAKLVLYCLKSWYTLQLFCIINKETAKCLITTKDVNVVLIPCPKVLGGNLIHERCVIRPRYRGHLHIIYHVSVSYLPPSFKDTLSIIANAMFNPLRSYRHPALRDLALAKVVYDHLAVLD